MFEPTLVNSAIPFNWVLIRKNTLRNGEKLEEKKCEDKPQRGVLPHLLSMQPVQMQGLENVRWRRIYIDRRTPTVFPYPAIR